MGVYRAAAVPLIVMFLFVGLIGHNTGRLREIPVVGPPWDEFTTELISGFYDLTGLYLGVVGTIDREINDHIPLQAYDIALKSAQQRSSYTYPYWSYTGFPREKLPEILQSDVVQKFVESVIEEAEERVSKKEVPRDQYILYLRGTAYEVMVEKAKYCAGGPTKDPRYVVTHCGDCDDWHVIAYVIISKINEEHGIEARYFLTLNIEHGFLTVYYPEEQKWEIYDWFPPIGEIENPGQGTSYYIELNGYCIYYLGIPQDECAVKIRRFESFKEVYEFYDIYGCCGDPMDYLFELPSLKYTLPSDIE